MRRCDECESKGVLVRMALSPIEIAHLMSSTISRMIGHAQSEMQEEVRLGVVVIQKLLLGVVPSRRKDCIDWAESMSGLHIGWPGPCSSTTDP